MSDWDYSTAVILSILCVVAFGCIIISTASLVDIADSLRQAVNMQQSSCIELLIKDKL